MPTPRRPGHARSLAMLRQPRNCESRVINEDRNIPVVNGKFNDIFSNADSVHIYRVNC
jgi:hypothetical protein